MSLSRCILLCAFLLAPLAPANAEEGNPTEVADEVGTASADSSLTGNDGLHYMVPALEGSSTRLSSGPRQFLRRGSFSPGYGRFGDQEYFTLRFAYNPNAWLGWEIALGHNPASSVHGVIHNLSALLRYPLASRFQPYASVGYGMLTIYPGKTINADPVTKNAFTYGGGLEIYLRDDVAVRGEILAASVLGRDPVGVGTATYTYQEITIGFSFYRSLGR